MRSEFSPLRKRIQQLQGRGADRPRALESGAADSQIISGMIAAGAIYKVQALPRLPAAPSPAIRPLAVTASDSLLVGDVALNWSYFLNTTTVHEDRAIDLLFGRAPKAQQLLRVEELAWSGRRPGW
jgi:hypothetical protein